MIQKVSFRNFKAYRSLDLDLEPLTVLVGPNASGKTTLLQGLHLATSLAEFPKASERTGLMSYGTTGLTEWALSGMWEETAWTLRVKHDASNHKLEVNGGRGGRPFTMMFTSGKSGLGFETAAEDAAAAVAFALKLESMLLRLEAHALAAASYSEDAIPTIGGNGSGLASSLAYLKLSEDEVFDEVEQALKQIIPSVRRIRIERALVEQTMLRTLALDEQRHQIPEQRTLWGNKVILDMRGAKGVDADSVGEGTLMALGLLTVLMGPNKPRLLLLDDIELNLHPVAQGRLIETLRKLQKSDPGLQIVATSHSPFILNYLKPEEVRMVFPSDNGYARCEKLTAHPEFDRWKDLMSPGEFWSTVGESWVGKAPAKP